MPTTRPELLFTDQVTALLGPPRVPRSVRAPSRHSAACRILLPAKFEYPASQPGLLMLLARLFVPPNDGRSVIVYCVCCCDAANKPQPQAINTTDKGIRRSA